MFEFILNFKCITFDLLNIYAQLQLSILIIRKNVEF